MAEYIVWVRQSEDCWKRHDAIMLADAQDIQRRESDTRAAIVTRFISEAMPAGIPADPAEAGPAAADDDHSAAAEAPPATGDTIADQSPAAPAPQVDLEIQALSQLKAALETLDPPTVWRVAHWVLEYARHKRKEQEI